MMNECWGRVCVRHFDGFLDEEEARKNIVELSHQNDFKALMERVLSLLESHLKPLSNEEILELDREDTLKKKNQRCNLCVAFKLIDDERVQIFKDQKPACSVTVYKNVLK